jgi:hypothetical protein
MHASKFAHGKLTQNISNASFGKVLQFHQALTERCNKRKKQAQT